MATVLGDSQMSEASARESVPISLDRLTRADNRGTSPILEIIVLVNDGAIGDGVDLTYVTELAKKLNASVTIVYVTSRPEVPESWEEYARVEKDKDYVWRYLESLGEGKTARLKREAIQEGLECTSFTYIGNVKEAIRIFEQRSDVMLVVPTSYKWPRRILAMGTLASQISRLRAPMLFIPSLSLRRKESS